MATYATSSGLGNMPCNGNTAIIGENNLGAESIYPPVILNMTSLGSGTTIKTLVPTSDNGITVDGTLTNADQWNQSGNFYQATITRSATDANARRFSCADDRYVPNASGFTCMALIKCPAAFNANTGIFGKIHSSYATTRGFLVATDGTAANIIASIDDPSTAGKTASLAIAALVASQYALVTITYSTAAGGTLVFRIDSSAGTSTATTTGVGATTLGLSAASYSPFYAGTTPATAAGYGLLAFGGQFIWSAMWDVVLVKSEIDVIADNPFIVADFPRGVVQTYECPQSMSVAGGAGAVERTKFTAYIGTSFDKGASPGNFLITAIPGTPGTRSSSPPDKWTRQEWADATMGGTSTGTPSADYTYQSNGGPGWPELCDSTEFPLAVVVPMDYYNGQSFLGNGSEPNGSMIRRRALQIVDYFDGITLNPLPTDDRNKMCITGISAGAAEAMTIAIQRGDVYGYAVPCHSEFGDGGVVATLNTYFDTQGNRESDWTVPPSGTFGLSLSTYTPPTGPGITSSNGRSTDWKNNSTSKSVRILQISGTAAPLSDDFPSGNAKSIDEDIALMRTYGYNNIRHKQYTSGRHAEHSHDRDLVVAFLRYGFGYFFHGTKNSIGGSGSIGVQVGSIGLWDWPVGVN